MSRPQSYLRPYTEHRASPYVGEAQPQSTLVYSPLYVDARPSEGVSSTPTPERIDQRVRRAITIMEQCLHRDLSLDEIANHVNLSRWHFAHIFKSETEMSPAQYLKWLRLQRAKELLESTFLSFKEIKCRVGIRDESHFGRSFKKAFGTPPREYRARFLSSGVCEAISHQRDRRNGQEIAQSAM